MEAMILKWHMQMSQEVELEYIASIRPLELISPIPRWQLFVGCGLSARFWHSVTAVWLELYGVKVAFADELMCERDPDKQAFLKEQFKPAFLIDNVEMLDKDLVANLMVHPIGDSQVDQLLPFVRAIDVGVPCVSRTPMSSSRKQNVNCVQEGKAATGEGFQHLMAACTKHWPELVAIECVSTLAQKCDSQVSDSEWMLQELRNEGYWAHSETLEATEFGSYVPRFRLWWAALLNCSGASDTMTHHFKRILSAFKMDPLPVNSFLTFDEDVRRQQGKQIGLKVHADFGPRDPKMIKKDPEWKLEHKLLFKAHGIDWPANFEGPECKGISCDGMLPREREAAAFCHIVWPPNTPVDLAFLDVNQSLGRLIGSCLDDQSLAKPDSTPWRPRPPTLVGSGKVLARIPDKVGSGCHLRVLEGFEYMRLIGWADDCWQTPPADLDSRNSCDHAELLANMAGNAFTMFHYGPFQLALISTFGRFHDAFVPVACNPSSTDNESNSGGSSTSD
jgi:hypothetical protein